jgi:hypothetical protein
MGRGVAMAIVQCGIPFDLKVYVYPGMLLPKFYGKLIQKVQLREEQSGCKDEGM